MLNFNTDRMTALEQSKMRSDDRIITLKVKEGSKPTSSTGMVDSRLFKGGNVLHAKRDDMNSGLWKLYYEAGNLPPGLSHHFTSIHKLLDHTKAYFSTRNIEIVEVKDNYASE